MTLHQIRRSNCITRCAGKQGAHAGVTDSAPVFEKLATDQKQKGKPTRACYIRAVLNKSWKQHPTKEKLYGNIPVISEIVRERRTKYAGHCY